MEGEGKKLLCGVCGEVFKNPVTLWGCGHCVCQGCAQTLFDCALMTSIVSVVPSARDPLSFLNSSSHSSAKIQQQQASAAAAAKQGSLEEEALAAGSLVRIECVSCGKCTAIPPESGVKSLPPNEDLARLCDRTLDQTSGARRSCDNCQQQQVAVDCADCELSYCSSCADLVHAPPVFKRHKRFASGQTNPSKSRSERKATCPKHPTEQTNLFCAQDDELVCAACVFSGDHKGHSCLYLNDAIQKISIELDGAREAIDKLRGTLESRVEDYKNNKTSIEGAATKAKGEVCGMFDELFEAMSRYKQSILETIDSCVGVATTQHQGLVNLIDKANHIVREIDDAKKNGDGASARDRLDVKQRANKLQKVLENVKLTQAVRTGQNTSPLIQFTLDLGDMLKALTHSSSLSLPVLWEPSTPPVSIRFENNALTATITHDYNHTQYNVNKGTLLESGIHTWKVVCTNVVPSYDVGVCTPAHSGHFNTVAQTAWGLREHGGYRTQSGIDIKAGRFSNGDTLTFKLDFNTKTLQTWINDVVAHVFVDIPSPVHVAFSGRVGAAATIVAS